MEKGQGKGTDTLHRDNDYLRRGDVKRLLENVVCLHEELPAQIDLIPAADVVARDCYDRLLAENDELRKERPVVRCKDCTHSRKGKASLECEKHAYVWDKRLRWVDDNDFCCWGVRKDGDNHA